jgi:hypothetical protein
MVDKAVYADTSRSGDRPARDIYNTGTGIRAGRRAYKTSNKGYSRFEIVDKTPRIRKPLILPVALGYFLRVMPTPSTSAEGF